MSNLPCENPSCHSCGKPHPNCKCYNYAKGGGVVSPDELKGAVVESSSESGQEVPLEQLQGAQIESSPEAGKEVPLDQLKGAEVETPEDYTSLGQRLLGDAEALGEGYLGPIPSLVETKFFGMDPKDIKGRADAFPIEHGILKTGALATSLLTNAGLPGLIGRGAGAIAEAAQLGKIGSAVLKGALETATFTGSDEITKALLEQPGSNPEHPVSAALLHVGAAGIMGAATGGVFKLGEGLIGKGIEGLNNQKMVEKAQKFLDEVGASGDPLGKLGVTSKIKEALSMGAATTIATKTGSGPWSWTILKKMMDPIAEKITAKPINKANQYITDALMKGLSTNEAPGIPNAAHYARQIGMGVNKAYEGIEKLFKVGASQVAEPVYEGAKKQLEKFIEEGQVTQQLQNQEQAQSPSQGFAHGGAVVPQDPQVSPTPDRFATIFPQQNTILNAAKGRISGYLNSLRPTPNQPKLAFDEPPSDTDKKRQYEKALNFAVNPMKILDHVNRGDLTPDDMKHFTALYPEVHRYLSGELTNRIVKAQLKGEKPPYAKRQAMSLFLGANLDGSLSPAAIQAAQNVFAQKQQAQQVAQKPAKGSKKASSLEKSSQSYLTDDQAAQRRQQSVRA